MDFSSLVNKVMREICLLLTIHGLVQGVGFRYGMAREARRLGLNGWVRNRRDGSVESLVSGGELAVGQLLDWAHRGPSNAQVDRVVSQPWTGKAPPAGFVLEATV